jgi:vanillate O-demethylase monooxygenase subunit
VREAPAADSRALPPLVNTSPLARHSWHPVAYSEDVTDTEPVQVWIADEPWVLTRLDGTLTAFLDRCPHRLAPLSAGRVTAAEDGSSRLACGYHGWRFGSDGQCDLIPSLGKSERISRRAALTKPAGLSEAYGLVWLAPDAPVAPIPDYPEWDDSSFATARSTVVRTHVGAAQLVDNFLDAAHFPYVHAASFGVDDGEALDGGEVITADGAVQATFSTAYRESGEVFSHTVRKTAAAAFNVHVRLDLGDKAALGILFACIPEKAGLTKVVKLLARNDIHGDAARLSQLVKDEDQILVEDLTILERYPSQALPLDPRVELHTRSDKLSLAWRTLAGAAGRDLPPSPRPTW